jgi:hypothetical protein
MMNAHGLESLKGGLQSEKGRQRILGALTGIDTDPVTGLVAQQLFQTISLLLGQIKDLVKTLEQKVANDEVVKRLQTIPGCGLITASTIRAALDDIGRFPGPKTIRCLCWVGTLGPVFQHEYALWENYQEGTGRTSDCLGTAGTRNVSLKSYGGI